MLLRGGFVDAESIGIDGQDRGRDGGILERQPSVAAADLENALAAETHEAFDQPQLDPFLRVGGNLGGHRGILSEALRESSRDRPPGSAAENRQPPRNVPSSER